MPITLDAADHERTPRRFRRPLIILAVLIVLFVASGQTFLSYWVDLLWFRSLGYGEVFWTERVWQASVFCVCGLLTFALLYGCFQALKRLHGDNLPTSRSLVLNGRPVNFSVEPVLRLLGLGGSALIAFFTAASIASAWSTLALFWSSRGHAGGVVDPVFGKPLTFFLFTLPAWQLLLSWLMTLGFLFCVIALLFFAITAGARALQKGDAPLYGGRDHSPWRGLLLTVSFLLLVFALNVYVDRFSHILEHRTLFDGVNYTEAHITLPGLLLVCFALLLGAGIALASGLTDRGGGMLVGAILPALVCYVGLGIVSWYVEDFVVKPNQLVRETPYIANNIALTRQAYGLDRFSQHEFPAETGIASADAANNQPTLNNIRLWDWHALQDTLRQVQEIRTYYDFPDIDIDRYVIDGHLREVMLATRELNVEKLPESSRNWINEKLVYTHGYGLTVNPVNGFTPEGLPLFLLRDMPVQSTVPELAVKRPEIYFGELTNTDVYVKTRQQEFDYPQGQTNNVTTYQGEGGIVLGGFLRRALLALDRGDLGKVPFSDDIGTESRLLMRRNIRERVAALAPFLTFDQDPYIVVNDDGRLSWILDAFTTSDSYPYSTHYQLGDNAINYMRNSVKVVVDPYNGSTTFYVFDPADPIVTAYRRLFPTLFKDASAMPAGLRRHVRYSELLFKMQSAVYGLYHMTAPEVFFNREDLWTVATQTESNEGEQSPAPMQPNYVLMKLPGGTSEEFVEILPFTPANRNNLIGWVAGRCDGDNYGSAVVYDFPKSRLVDGPQQIEARIDQNAQLSGQLTLWNQQGSHVLRGNLLVIPMGKALLYAEPIYLQAQQSPMPELRLVVLALQDKLAYGPTFQTALTSLFGGETSSLSASETSGPSPSPAGNAATPANTGNALAAAKAPTDTHGLIVQASQAFSDYQHLTAEGKLGEAGQKLEDLKRALAQLSTREH